MQPMQLGAGHVLEWGSSLLFFSTVAAVQYLEYLLHSPLRMMGRGGGRSGGGRGARVACRQGKVDEPPAHPPYFPPIHQSQPSDSSSHAQGGNDQ